MFDSPLNNFMFNTIPFTIFIVFSIIIMVFIVVLVKSLSEYVKNNNAPKLSEPAQLIVKRTHTWGGRGEMGARTSYYATFETTTGERIEFPVSSQFAGLHAEGDTGILTHQGSRFLSFQRDNI